MATRASLVRVRSVRLQLLARASLLCLVAMSFAVAGQTVTSSPAIAGNIRTNAITQLAPRHTTHHKHSKHTKHAKHHTTSKHVKHATHTKPAIRASSHVRALDLTTNIAPSPDFLSSCPAADQSYFCLGQEIEAIDNARAEQGLGPMDIRLDAFRQLSTAEQLFALTDLERTARNLPPVVALTAQLNSVATNGATQTADPSLAGWTLSGGKQAIAWNSNWAGGLSSLAANYYWMYSDGQGFNVDCTQSNQSGCWQHRQNILVRTTGNCGSPTMKPQLVMGAGSTRSAEYGPSDAEILVQECGGLPSDTLFTWTQTEKILGIPLT